MLVIIVVIVFVTIGGVIGVGCVIVIMFIILFGAFWADTADVISWNGLVAANKK